MDTTPDPNPPARECVYCGAVLRVPTELWQAHLRSCQLRLARDRQTLARVSRGRGDDRDQGDLVLAN